MFNALKLELEAILEIESYKRLKWIGRTFLERPFFLNKHYYDEIHRYEFMTFFEEFYIL